MVTKESEKFISSNILEGMTSISALLNSSEFNTRKIIKVLYNEDKIKKHLREFNYLRRMSELHGFPLETVSSDVIEQNTIGNTHGGVIALCTDRIIDKLSPENIVENGVYFTLEGIEDPYNFGYSLRSFYASGVNGIILSPRNWMSAAGVVARASAGASELFPMYISEPVEAMRLFKEKG